MKKVVAILSVLILFFAIGLWIHSNIVVQRFDDSVFNGKAKLYFPELWNDPNHMKWITFVRNYRLNAIERRIFTRRVLRRMSNKPTREEIRSFLTMTAEWQIYGQWNGNDEGGGVDFGRCEEAKPLLRKFLTEIDEDEFRTRHRHPFHWYEGTNGILYISHISFTTQ